MTKFAGDDFSHSEKFKHEKPIVHFGFSSLAAMTNFIQRLPINKEDEGRTIGRAEFYGTDSIARAFELTRNGWQRGAEEAAKVAEAFETERVQELTRGYSVAGSSVSVGRMLAGNPEHMRRKQKAPGRKVVTIFSELSVSAGVSSSVMARRAAIVAAICDRLESSGYSCEIVAVCTITSDGVDGNRCAYNLSTILKNAGEKLNINDVVFGLGHPSMFRRFCFSLCCAQSELRNVWSSQGYPSRSFSRGSEEIYLSAPSIEEAREIQKTQNVKKWIELISPEKLLDLLKFNS